MMYSLRPVNATDWEFWRGLHRAGYEARVVELWGEWDEHLQGNFARKEFETAHDGQFVVIVAGRDAGYLSWDWRADHLFLSVLVLDNAYRGKGLGAIIVNDVCALAMKRGLPIQLQTLVNNPARRLYERLGFKVVGEDGKHVIMRREDASE